MFAADQEIVDYLEKASDYAEEGNYIKAYEQCQNAIQLFPDSELPYMCWADLLDQEKRMDDADAKLEEGHQVHPNSFAICLNLATRYSINKAYEKAEEFYKKAQLIENSWYLLMNWAEMYLTQGNLDLAIKKLEEATSLNPKNDQILLRLSEVLESANRVDESIAAKNRAIVVKGAMSKAELLDFDLTTIDKKNAHDMCAPEYRAEMDEGNFYRLDFKDKQGNPMELTPEEIKIIFDDEKDNKFTLYEVKDELDVTQNSKR